ncbi:hypothetical protein AX15_005364 [Amanita polypyramis BW_CC]|nr:hypothetical protein AX15_005364 [Amanita polypyramis BW_CC]
MSTYARVDENDESVRIALSALGDMRNAVSPQCPPSSSLVTRVSHLPLVNSVLRTYEQGKASSRVVKYGAEMMESSVRSISRPVIDRLPVGVGRLDEFACRQLDRFDRYRRTSSCEADDRPSTLMGTSSECSTSLRYDWRPEPSSPRIPQWLETTNNYASPHALSPDSRSSTPTQVSEENGKLVALQNDAQNSERQVAQRSRWHAVLLEAGGFGAALSDENMRRLKYCLHCLQYATAQIDAQILILRDFIAGLQPLPPPSTPHGADPSSSRRPVSQAHMRALTDVRRDLVQTIRQVVDVVSKYAGSALPEPARTRVRGCILKLPQRWASKAGVSVPSTNINGIAVEGGGERERERESVTAAASGSGVVRRTNRRAPYRERGAGADSKTSSRAPSPTSPRAPRSTVDTASPGDTDKSPGGSAVTAGAAVTAAQRILTLATESLDMMRGVTGVMKDSLDRADAWVNRLRTVGIQRNGPMDELIPEEGAEAERAPPPSPKTGERQDRRRASSNYSNATEDDGESYHSNDNYYTGLTSPVISVPGSASGSSTAYSSSYNVMGLASGPSTPGGYMTAGMGTQNPSVFPIVPLSAMSLDKVGEGKVISERLALGDVERMDVDV